MAKNGYKVLDSDMHLLEPPDLWERYIDPAFRDRAPRGLTRYPRDLAVELDGTPLTKPYRDPRYLEGQKYVQKEQNPIYQDSEDRGWDGFSQVQAMDKEGIDVAILFPSRGLFALARDGLDPELTVAISRAYNDWMYDFSREGPGRMYGTAMVPPHNLGAAVEEARRTVNGLGFKAIFMRPNLVNGRNWYDPCYDPLWAELESLGVPLTFHEGGAYVDLPQAGKEFETYMMNHTCTHPMGMMLACVSFVGGGILERFPGLRVAFLEANCSWVPWLLWRMDEHYEHRGKYESPDLKLKPSEYFKRQCYVSVECDEEPSIYVSNLGYEDNVVFSTDYPHQDSKYPHAVEAFLELPLGETTKRKFLWDNCARLYDL